MVELLRPKLSGAPLDFSAANRANAAKSSGRDPVTEEQAFSRGEPAFNFNGRDKKVDSIRGYEANRNSNLKAMSGGNITAGSVSKRKTGAQLQSSIDQQFEQGK